MSDIFKNLPDDVCGRCKAVQDVVKAKGCDPSCPLRGGRNA